MDLITTSGYRQDRQQRADLSQLAQREYSHMPMLERIYRLKADRDTQWAIFDSNTAYQRTVEKAAQSQTNAMAQIAAQQAGATERTQMGITAKETKAEQERLVSEQAQQGLLERTGYRTTQEGQLEMQKERQEREAVEFADAKAKAEDWRLALAGRLAADSGEPIEKYQDMTQEELDFEYGKRTTQRATEKAAAEKAEAKKVADLDAKKADLRDRIKAAEAALLKKAPKAVHKTAQDTLTNLKAELSRLERGFTLATPEDVARVADAIEKQLGRVPNKAEVEAGLNAEGLTAR